MLVVFVLSYLTIVFLNGTALFIIVRTLFAETAQSGFHYSVAGNTIYLGETLVSVLVLACVGVLFVFAKPFLQRLHTILAIVMLLGIAVTSAICLPGALTGDVLRSFGTRGIGRGYAVLSLVIMAPWAFVGFEVITFDTAHFRFPARKSGGHPYQFHRRGGARLYRDDARQRQRRAGRIPVLAGVC